MDCSKSWLVVLCLCALASCAQARDDVASSTEASTLGLPIYLAGRSHSDDMRGSAQILQFWATWCQSCKGEAQKLTGVVEANVMIRYWAISTDERFTEAETVAEQMSTAAHGLASVLYDDGAQWAKRYCVVSVPTVVVLDGAGVELDRFVGHLSSSDLARIAHLLDDAVDSKATEAKE